MDKFKCNGSKSLSRHRSFLSVMLCDFLTARAGTHVTSGPSFLDSQALKRPTSFVPAAGPHLSSDHRATRRDRLARVFIFACPVCCARVPSVFLLPGVWYLCFLHQRLPTTCVCSDTHRPFFNTQLRIPEYTTCDRQFDDGLRSEPLTRSTCQQQTCSSTHAHMSEAAQCGTCGSLTGGKSTREDPATFYRPPPIPRSCYNRSSCLPRFCMYSMLPTILVESKDTCPVDDLVSCTRSVHASPHIASVNVLSLSSLCDSNRRTGDIWESDSANSFTFRESN